MNWRFNDGTVATLGGNIEGASVFAQELRAMLERPRIGVSFGRMPDGGAWLDKNDAALFDAWLRQEMSRPFRHTLKLKLTEVPKNIPALPKQDDVEVPDDAIA